MAIFSEMFSSIKWKFIVVYFLLVFIAMVIIGIFIVGKLETQQIDNVTTNMEQHIKNIINTSSYLQDDDWESVQIEIQETLNEWRIDSRENLYVIYNGEVPTIIASSLKDRDKVIDQNALSYKHIDPTLILKANKGSKASGKVKSVDDDRLTSHLAYPVLTEYGEVKGFLYMISDLKDAMETVEKSKIILTNATLIALLITITLGYFIANSITEPIRDVTKKVEEMAEGDFDQKVEVRSNDEIGQLASMFNYLTSELKSTINEMDVERSKLDTIFNYMTEGVVAINREGHIIHANPIGLEILDMDNNKSFLDKEGLVEFPYEKVSFDRVDYSETEELEGDTISEIDGEIYKIKYAPYKMEMDDIGGLILVFQNMTNEYKLDDLRKEFVANVSHELKTPITTIKSYTETLMDGGIDKSVQLNFLHVIDDECNRMGRLVSDLLQLSNMDFKKTVWEKEELNVNRFVKDIVGKLDLSFDEKNQSCQLILDDKLPNIKADRDAIEQVLLNIISNAIKYTEEEGLIVVETDYTDNFVSISVTDDGIGIPEEDLQRIFERFYRVEKGRSRDLGGTGLGLAIAKEIIDGHNGYINMDSRYKEGTRVEIKLPHMVV